MRVTFRKKKYEPSPTWFILVDGVVVGNVDNTPEWGWWVSKTKHLSWYNTWAQGLSYGSEKEAKAAAKAHILAAWKGKP